MGLPLLDWIFTQEETTESDCALLLVQVIEALLYLHSRHITYLDLKPENILIDILRTSQKGDLLTEEKIVKQPAIRLIDLGNARHLELPTENPKENQNNTSKCNDQTIANVKSNNNDATAQTDVGKLRVPSKYPPLILGSPEFTAPEVLERKVVGVLADNWSLGVLIYVLVSGKSPFLDISVEATSRNIISGDIRYPVEHFSSVTQEACDLTQALLLQNPQERLPLQDVLTHPWFHMVECESILPLHSLADFSCRRAKLSSSTQELPSAASSIGSAVSSPAGTQE
ncbi:putative protein kinase superfamily [Halocaridina rubra]|uniref:Protein kinase domain-containing protein n=1 Tax=Halocaridina rubra TaxID=373956 RepID=A0AAN8XSL4_HALRR